MVNQDVLEIFALGCIASDSVARIHLCLDGQRLTTLAYYQTFGGVQQKW